MSTVLKLRLNRHIQNKQLKHKSIIGSHNTIIVRLGYNKGREVKIRISLLEFSLNKVRLG